MNITDALARMRRFSDDLAESTRRGCGPLGFIIRSEEQAELVEAFALIFGPGADMAVPCDGPYRPELAEAFRQGARELQLDCLDIERGALVEEGDGGAYVHCRVYVSDAQRLPMPGEDDDAADSPEDRSTLLAMGRGDPRH